MAVPRCCLVICLAASCGWAAPDGYRDPALLTEAVAAWGPAGVAAITKLADSPGGRPVLLASFGTVAEDRPGILVIANPDGDRPGASQVALALAERLAGKPLLESLAVHLVVVANPDAEAACYAGGPIARGAPLDDDRDRLTDEDPPDDLDGDGLITWMRVPDPTGDYLADPADPRAMRRADRAAGEAGTHRLLIEGGDDDGDRQINEDGPGGVRYELNWPHRWRQGEPAAGPWPLSEPETRGLADWVLAHPELRLAVVLGAEDNLSTPQRPIDQPEASSTALLRDDAALVARLAERLLADLTTKPRGAGDGSGNLADWLYYHVGLPVLESAVWSPPLEAPRDEPRRADEVRLLAWDDQVLGGEGLVPWTAYRHPLLGEVEIGGWKPLLATNPPEAEIGAIADRWAAFLGALPDDLPRLGFDKVEVRDAGGGLREIRATLVNAGGLPTVSVMGEIVRRVRPLRVSLEIPDGGQLLAGRLVQFVSRLRERGGAQEFRWMIRVPEGAVARVWVEGPGTARTVRDLAVTR